MTNSLPGSHTPAAPKTRLPLTRWLIAAGRAFIIFSVPLFLVLTSVRLVMSEPFLWLEYHRPGFPDDRYGFTQDQRLDYASEAIYYLHSDAGINHLGDLTLDGAALFNARELRHMEDVKVVTRAALQIHTLLSLGLAVLVAVMLWRRDSRPQLRRALSAGAVLTIALIAALILVAVTSWDTFFTQFHRVFFEGDTWLFRTSDTLIRLFPEQFWFDAALIIGTLTFAGAVLTIVLTQPALWRQRSESKLRRVAPQTDPNDPANSAQSR